MKSKKFFVVWVSLLVIILLALVIINIPKKDSYSEEPKLWIETKGSEKEINVEKATDGQSHFDRDMGQQYETETIGTAFDLEGWYKGNYFKREYMEDNRVTIRISNEMQPNDGVIEGFVMEKIENNIPYLYIFLDEDWKNNVENTNIYWGRSYQNKKIFDFSSQISAGIYMNKVKDDENRFQNNYGLHIGGVYAGDLRDDDKSTIISFY